MNLIAIDDLTIPRKQQYELDMDLIPLASYKEELNQTGRFYNCTITGQDLTPDNGWFLCIGPEVHPIHESVLTPLKLLIDRGLTGELRHLTAAEAIAEQATAMRQLPTISSQVGPNIYDD